MKAENRVIQRRKLVQEMEPHYSANYAPKRARAFYNEALGMHLLPWPDFQKRQKISLEKTADFL